MSVTPTTVARRFLDAMLVDVPRDEFEYDRDTPARMLRAFRELVSGYTYDPKVRTFATDGCDQIIAVRSIPFASLCAHHVLPFTGLVDVAYLPNEKIIGLSKVPRIVRQFSRRLQVQERLTEEIADALIMHVEPRGVAVLVQATHTCMTLRGVEGDGRMVTSVMRGFFRDDDKARVEVMQLLGWGAR